MSCSFLRGSDHCATSVLDTASVDREEEGDTANVAQSFLGWLYTDRIFWQPLFPEESLTDAKDEDDFNDPVTWRWMELFTFYVFADAHDTKALRNSIMDVVLQKTFQVKPRTYSKPNLYEFKRILNELPETSPLHRMLIDFWIYDIESSRETDADDMASFPAELLVRVLRGSSNLARKLACPRCKREAACDYPHSGFPLQAGYKTDMCKYHEHESEQEKKSCAKKWKELRIEHGIVWKHEVGW